MMYVKSSEINYQDNNSMLKRNIFFLALILILSCRNKDSDSFAVVEVEILNHKQLDSIIVYDKSARWRIESCLRFDSGSTCIDTLGIKHQRMYQLFSFTKGVQSELGELVLSPKGKIKIVIDEDKPFRFIRYIGSFESINNVLANSKKHLNELTITVREGISEEELQIKIDEKKAILESHVSTSNIPDSMQVYISENFKKFTEILKKKNAKAMNKLIDVFIML